MKKILISVSIIAGVAAIAIGATTAFFSDTETSTGNIFTAGAIDLQIDSNATYNGQLVSGATWGLKDLVPTSDKFFNFADIKPGDSGENTISLHVFNNDAWVCAEVSGLTNADNSTTEPESSAPGQTSGGDLQNAMVWTIWRDDGDNVLETAETILASGHPVNGVLPIYDSTTGTGALVGDSAAYLGVEWSLPLATGNEVQTDSLTGDISFNVVQARNNDGFRCVPQQPEMAVMNLENKDDQWHVIDDNTSGTITYSVNDSTFHGTVAGQGLVAGAYYQITLNGPHDGCSFTNLSLGNFAGGNTFKGGFWDSAWPNLSPTCTANDEEGSYNMTLIGDHYTFIASGTGTFTYDFNYDLPNGNYGGVKILVKKMLDAHTSPWVDTTTEHTTNLFEIAPISFTVL